MRRIVIALAFTVAACSGGYGTVSLALKGKGVPPQPGAVSVQAATTASSGALVKNVIVTLSRIEVHLVPPDSADRSGPDEDPERAGVARDGGRVQDDEAGWVTVPLATRQFDLMSLQNEPAATLGQLHLPVGKITQIRLFLDPAGKNAVILSDGTSCAVDLSNLPGDGIRITHPFKAINLPANEKVTVVVDLDLHAVQSGASGCTYRIDPVIQIERVDVEDQNEPGRTGERGRGDDLGDGGD